MTLAVDTTSVKARIDWTKPVLWLFAACLVVLIVLPMSWLAVFAFTDKARQITLQNFTLTNNVIRESPCVDQLTIRNITLNNASIVRCQ